MPRQIDQIAQTPEAYAAKLREVLDHPAAEQSAGARVGLRCFLQMQWLKGLQPAVASAAYALLTPAELLKVLRAHCEAVEELVAESSPSQPAPAPSAAAAMSASTSSLAATPHMRQLLLLMCAAHLDYLVQAAWGSADSSPAYRQMLRSAGRWFVVAAQAHALAPALGVDSGSAAAAAAATAGADVIAAITPWLTITTVSAEKRARMIAEQLHTFGELDLVPTALQWRAFFDTATQEQLQLVWAAVHTPTAGGKMPLPPNGVAMDSLCAGLVMGAHKPAVEDLQLAQRVLELMHTVEEALKSRGAVTASAVATIVAVSSGLGSSGSSSGSSSSTGGAASMAQALSSPATRRPAAKLQSLMSGQKRARAVPASTRTSPSSSGYGSSSGSGGSGGSAGGSAPKRAKRATIDTSKASALPSSAAAHPYEIPDLGLMVAAGVLIPHRDHLWMPGGHTFLLEGDGTTGVLRAGDSTRITSRAQLQQYLLLQKQWDSVPELCDLEVLVVRRPAAPSADDSGSADSAAASAAPMQPAAQSMAGAVTLAELWQQHTAGTGGAADSSSDDTATLIDDGAEDEEEEDDEEEDGIEEDEGDEEYHESEDGDDDEEDGPRRGRGSHRRGSGSGSQAAPTRIRSRSRRSRRQVRRTKSIRHGHVCPWDAPDLCRMLALGVLTAGTQLKLSWARAKGGICFRLQADGGVAPLPPAPPAAADGAQLQQVGSTAEDVARAAALAAAGVPAVLYTAAHYRAYVRIHAGAGASETVPGLERWQVLTAAGTGISLGALWRKRATELDSPNFQMLAAPVPHPEAAQGPIEATEQLGSSAMTM